MTEEETPVSESEMQLLAELKKRVQISSTVSISGIASALGISSDAVKEGLAGLQLKGLIRYQSFAATRPETGVSRIEAPKALSSLVVALSQLQSLEEKKGETKQKIYSRVRRELLDKIEDSTRVMDGLRVSLDARNRAIRQRISDIDDQIEEIRVRESIGAIGADESARQIRTLSEEAGNLQSQMDGLRELFKEKDQLVDQGRIQELREKISDLNTQLEVLWARKQVGELDETEYNRQRQKLEQAGESISQELMGLTQKTLSVDKPELSRRLSQLETKKVIPQKLSKRVASLLEEIT